MVVALPEDMLTATTDVAPLRRPAVVFEPAADAEVHCRRSGRCLEMPSGRCFSSAAPTGRSEGRAAFCRFRRSSDIPVVAAFRYQDQFDNNSPVFVGEAGVGMAAHVKTLMRDADVILAVNVRFGEMTTDGYTLLAVPRAASAADPCARFRPRDRQDLHPGDRHPGGAERLCQGSVAGRGGWSAWRAKAARQSYEGAFSAPVQPGPVDMVAVCAWLRDTLPEDVILTNGAGNFTVWPNKFLRFGPKARLARAPVRRDGLRPAGRDRGEGGVSTAAPSSALPATAISR